MIVKPDNYEGDANSQEMLHLMKVENQALKEEAHEARNRVKDVEFENEQLRLKCSQIDQLYHRIETLQGSESEMTQVLKRQADLELAAVQQQSRMEVVLRDKRQVEADIDSFRDQMKVLMKDKLELENNLDRIQRHELTRLDELEHKFSEVTDQYITAKEELAGLRVTEINLNEQL